MEMGRRGLPPEEATENGDAEDLEDAELVEGFVAAFLEAAAEEDDELFEPGCRPLFFLGWFSDAGKRVVPDAVDCVGVEELGFQPGGDVVVVGGYELISDGAAVAVVGVEFVELQFGVRRDPCSKNDDAFSNNFFFGFLHTYT